MTDLQTLEPPMTDREERRAKVLALKARGQNPWPYSFRHKQRLSEARRAILTEHAPGTQGTESAWRVAGRVRSRRSSGAMAFLDIEDEWSQLQVVLQRDLLGSLYDESVALLNEGDFVGVVGRGMVTRRREPSILAERITLLAKAYRPPPATRDDLTPQVRYSKPYLNLIQGPEVRRLFRNRQAIETAFREELVKQDFLEVNVPVLEKAYGGASASPFKTYSNAKNRDMYLRVSHEPALKQLLVGGMERVWHMGPAFRNESIDRTHNPEFTELEAYAAYWDYNDMMRLTEDLFQTAADRIAESQPNGHAPAWSWEGPFERITMMDAVEQATGIDCSALDGREVREHLKRLGIEIPHSFSWGIGVQALFEHAAESNLKAPTFVIDHPQETTPLCKRHRSDSRLIERFELFINGQEHANAYSELNDPVEQRFLFELQASRRTQGDSEAYPTSDDLVDALEYGMPPAGGVGLGIDRVVMTLLGKDSIRDVLLFPQNM